MCIEYHSGKTVIEERTKSGKKGYMETWKNKAVALFNVW